MRHVLFAFLIFAIMSLKARADDLLILPSPPACFVPMSIQLNGPEAKHPGSLVLNKDGSWSATSMDTVREIVERFSDDKLAGPLARAALHSVAAGVPLNPHPDCDTLLTQNGTP